LSDATISIAGAAHALPARRVSSDELDERLGLPAGRLFEMCGVATRHFCEGESQIDLAVRASSDALADARISPHQVDLVIGGCGVPYQTLPATAPLVMRRLGLADGSAAAFDVNATCLSFVNALQIAASEVGSGRRRCALVFASEVASRALPWKDQPEVAGLFGDGAAAAVVTPGTRAGQGVRASLMETYPSGYEACQIAAGGTRIDFHRDPELFAANAFFRMDGRALFSVTHRWFPRFVSRLLDAAGWRQEDVDLVVPHQASPLALAHMVKLTKMDPAKVVDVAASIGNQIAASIPTALSLARSRGLAPAGTRLLLVGTSAGVSFGGMAIET
jgi:3-oxoacyl-[acyl-carrier-protein] synthase-3